MRLLTPEAVADVLALSRSSVRRMIIEGALPAVCLRSGKRKRLYRVREEALERWIASRERQGTKQRTEINNATIQNPAA